MYRIHSVVFVTKAVSKSFLCVLLICVGVGIGYVLARCKPIDVEKVGPSAEQIAWYKEMNRNYDAGKMIRNAQVEIMDRKYCAYIMEDERTIMSGIVRIPMELRQFEYLQAGRMEVFYVEPGVAVIILRKPYAFTLEPCLPKM